MSDDASALPIVRTISALGAQVRDWRAQGLSVGFVPTMGALHEGHLALVREARRRADRVVASVFVNPAQFAPTEDLDRYPRREAEDARLLAEVGCDLLYAPSVDAMYPAGSLTTIAVGSADAGPASGLEAEFRPQMFGGVALVVAKLLNQAQADVAVFGEKDFQQLMVVRRMAADLDIPTEIVGVPTERDDHGLALSSRNAYLSAPELEIARRLNGALSEAAARAAAGASVKAVETETTAALLQAGFDAVDYVAVRGADDLTRFAGDRVEAPARILAAVRLGQTRLIDNLPV